MVLRSSVLAILVCAVNFFAVAQDGTTRSSTEGENNAVINLAYFGNNFWIPGLSIGCEQSRTSIQKTNQRNITSTIDKLYFGDAGFFLDYMRQTSVFVHFGIARRKYYQSGFHTYAGVSPVGVLRAFFPETWNYSPSIGGERVQVAGRWYYAPSVTMGVGRLRNKTPGTGWFLELNLMALMPYNRAVMPLLNAKAGYRIPLNARLLKPKAQSTQNLNLKR